MNLRYINLSPDMDIFTDDFRYGFFLRARFIANYLSKQIRKHKFCTDGSFHIISINLVENASDGGRLVPDRVLEVDIAFNRDEYEQIKDSDNCEYYLRLLEEGFKKASNFKEIPLELLMSLIAEFRDNGCKNEWRHKKKRFREKNIEVALDCHFTTSDFKLVATIIEISTKTTLCSGVVLRTEPNEVCFDKEFKDILVDSKKIIITDGFDRPKILINLADALSAKLNFTVVAYNDLEDLSE